MHRVFTAWTGGVIRNCYERGMQETTMVVMPSGDSWTEVQDIAVAEAGEEIFKRKKPCLRIQVDERFRDTFYSEEKEEFEAPDPELLAMEERDLFKASQYTVREILTNFMTFMRVVVAKVAANVYKSAKHSQKLGDSLDMIIKIFKLMRERFPTCAALADLIDRLEKFNLLPMVVFFLGIIPDCRADLRSIKATC